MGGMQATAALRASAMPRRNRMNWHSTPQCRDAQATHKGPSSWSGRLKATVTPTASASDTALSH